MNATDSAHLLVVDDDARLRGRTRRNTTVHFSGDAAPGELVAVEIESATSTTLGGRRAALVAA